MRKSTLKSKFLSLIALSVVFFTTFIVTFASVRHVLRSSLADQEITELTVKLVWDDDEDSAGLRATPDGVILKLVAKAINQFIPIGTVTFDGQAGKPDVITNEEQGIVIKNSNLNLKSNTPDGIIYDNLNQRHYLYQTDTEIWYNENTYPTYILLDRDTATDLTDPSAIIDAKNDGTISATLYVLEQPDFASLSINRENAYSGEKSITSTPENWQIIDNNTWAYTFTNLDPKSTYQLYEEFIPNYSSTHMGEANQVTITESELTITNTLPTKNADPISVPALRSSPTSPTKAATPVLTKTITITKQWVGDNINNRPSDVTVYLNKTSSILLPGCQNATTNCPNGTTNNLEAKMKSLSGSGGTNSENTTITTIRKATDAQYEAIKSSLTANNEVQASGEKTYMWFDSGIIYFYSLADNIYLNANSSGLFRKMLNLVDVSGLAYFNTTYVTDMNRMFQDTKTLSDIAALANWDTGNVTNMEFMLGGNYASGNCITPMNFPNVTALANWNVSSVTNMASMFKCNVSLFNLAPIANWDVTNVTKMEQMFNRTNVTDISPIANWNVVNVEKATSGSKGFVMMFANTPNLANYASWPTFTKRAGKWQSNGRYDANDAASGAVTMPKKTPTPDQQICSGTAWDKSQEGSGIWTCTLTVSNDDSIYKVWEDATGLDDYEISNDPSDPLTVENDAIFLTNIKVSAENRAINLRKIVTGDAADLNKYFTFQVNAFDENGSLVPGYSRSIRLKHSETATVLVFTIPQEYSYEITETGTEYEAYNSIVKTDGGEVVKAQSAGTTTGRITPTENQTVTFTNTKTNSPTKTITIFKKWQGDVSEERPDIIAYLNKTTANLITGPALNIRMKQLAGSTASVNTADNKIVALNMATKAQYEAVESSLSTDNQVHSSSSPNPVYMWFSSGIIYFYSPADNIYMNTNSSSAFTNLSSLTDISALESFNTAYVEDMGHMFADSVRITNINDLSSWDTGNVTSMRYMFSGTYGSSCNPMNVSDLTPISGWNTQKVTTMDSMFKCAAAIRNLDAIAGWNVSNLTNMNQMFNRAGLTSMEGIKDWDVTRVSNFTNTLNNLPSLAIKYEFANRPGSWNTDGTYVPTNPAITTPLPTPTKVPTADQQTCTTWDKTQDSTGIWTCSLTVSNDNSTYKVWEEAVAGSEDALDYYTSSATSTSPTTVASSSATITNTMKSQDIIISKVWDDNDDVASTRPSNITVHLAKLNIQSVNNNDPSSGLNNTVFDANSFTDLATSGTWTDSGNNTWEYVFSIKASEDITKLYVYEDNVPGYSSDATATNPKTIPASKIVTITNTADRFDISLKKQVTGNLGVTSKAFNFNIKLFDPGGAEIIDDFSATKNGVNYTATFGADGYSGTFSHGDTITIHGLFTGYSYTITETDTEYSESYKITATDGSVLTSVTPGLSASRSITNKSQIVTFENNLEKTSTGVNMGILPYIILLLLALLGTGGHKFMLAHHYSQRINNQTYISLN